MWVDKLDKGIKDVVVMLNDHGFDTWESCEGGDGHAMPEPTVKFYGSEFDCIRAFELCEQMGYNPLNVRRVFRKDPLYDKSEQTEIGRNWIMPYNEIVFIKDEFGSITKRA